ncbi:cupin domain-containing protein [Mycolicibacillus parakoreensis]|uniref:Cupin domain-containing protein n=1 Tax=Mycolicibacillus parakoreensis TaxID=1069221 RepID=A0ABY3TZT5_9MYCO|nr:cupin domain-containing protein [Mycolicibacillus parakoreensis]MCV7314437.1 cupin domain-containing protein [Mycolicibacillus parakoreensis]ULN53223.1 cupin domain-containing protein [Mycolicibacillus parakoreensis]
MNTEHTYPKDTGGLPPEIAEAFAGVVRFRDVRPSWQQGGGGDDARSIPLFKYTDKADSDFAGGTPAKLTSREIRLTTGVLAPGEGARFHSHTTEELMFAASGSWIVFFDEQEKYKVHLEPMDAILVPANLKRGWRNVGSTIGCFLNISSVHDEMAVASCTVDPAERG